TREAALYIAANDGMLHSFDAGQCTGTPVVCTTGTGNETWAYVPRMVMPGMYRLADAAYGGNHRFFVDGSPEMMDIFVGSVQSGTSGLSAGWHTILVGGLGGGGRGFYALDITNPLVPVALWEICSDSALCRISDADLGYSYGNPVITKRSSDNRWVVLVTSGYNNTSSGTGQGYLYVLDAVSGAILSKIPTGSGSTTTPSGLAKISAWADDGNKNNVARFVYGGDLNGDVWRFDLGAPGTTATAYPALSSPAMHFVKLVDGAGVAQPITTRPELGDVSAVSGSIDSLNATGRPVVFIGTGRFLGTTDKSNTQTQTIYALRDDLSASVTQVNSRTRADVVQQTISLATGTSSNNTVDWGVKNGWYADFPAVGELVNIDPVLVLGTLTVVTNLPGSSSCETGGTSYQYQFNYKNGNNVPSAIGGAVRSKIGNALTVGIVVVRLPSGQLRVIATSAAGAKINVGLDVSGTSSTRNVSWRELLQ
ncbi:MAG: PilC/PilY family type IV pilus protein, partial [Gallionellaceae bacterium]|nr:PilC/PilY family type IV pilus protein [Gallionellaceae bacterium]